MHGRILVSLTLLTLLGCTEVPDAAPGDSLAKRGASSFDPARTGAIHGRVVWDGEVPVAEPMVVKTIAYHPSLFKNPVHCTLPHYPQVNAENHGVAGAVVFLRGIDPQHARPWDHASVRVEFKDRQLHIHQGERVSSVGFVKVGGEFEIVSKDADYHLLRGRGAAFVAAPLQVADTPSRRTLTQPGIVDLTSGAGYYWLHGHLFVVEHPYYTQTDADGNFRLDQVPPGKYELVSWMPSWVVTSRERDPETGVTARFSWAQPKEQVQTVEVQVNGVREVTYHWHKDVFDGAGR